MSGNTYRPDIDGLRAVAVLLVMASHLQVPHLAGGYIGVDVFFVISGYLITSIILPEIAAGTFTLRAFYLRRVRRIAPALLVMLTCTVPFARHFLFPTELSAYARSLVAAALACSNTLFWGWRGYFDVSNELKPLLHTWSLGVEEQFYLAFPLVLLVAVRHRAVRGAILTIAAISFALSCWFVGHNPRIAFFAAPLRAWELMLGAMLSQRANTRSSTAFVDEAAAVLGLALIFVPAVSYTDATAFPGFAALAPCLGAVLLIVSGGRATLVSRVLALRPVVFIGLISYSVYLWHWPLIAFANLRHTWTCEGAACGAPVSASERVAVFGLTLLLGTLSWRFVERPFRDRGLTSARTLITASATTLALLLGFAAYALGTRGEPARFPKEAVAAAEFLDFDTHGPWRWSSCALALDEPPALFDEHACLPYTEGHKHYLLLGDSHAAQLWPGVQAVFRELEVGQVNVAGCNLLPYKQQDVVPTCRAMAEYVYNKLLPSGRVDALIVGAQWHAEDLPHVPELLAYARARHMDVLLIGPNEAFPLSYPRLLARLETQQRVAELPGFSDPGERELDRRMALLARNEWHVPYFSALAQPCLGDLRCREMTADGLPMYLDRHHLTPMGAEAVAGSLREQRLLP